MYLFKKNYSVGIPCVLQTRPGNRPPYTLKDLPELNAQQCIPMTNAATDSDTNDSQHLFYAWTRQEHLNIVLLLIQPRNVRLKIKIEYRF
jgi:hypothetical protein